MVSDKNHTWKHWDEISRSVGSPIKISAWSGLNQGIFKQQGHRPGHLWNIHRVTMKHIPMSHSNSTGWLVHHCYCSPIKTNKPVRPVRPINPSSETQKKVWPDHGSPCFISKSQRPPQQHLIAAVALLPAHAAPKAARRRHPAQWAQRAQRAQRALRWRGPWHGAIHT